MLRKLLENSWVNPLSCIHSFDLVCFFTASAASKNVQYDLVHVRTKGVYRSFRKYRTNTEELTLICQDRIQKQKCKTFSDMQMYSRMKATHRVVLIKADQMLFVHAVQC